MTAGGGVQELSKQKKKKNRLGVLAGGMCSQKREVRFGEFM